MAAYLILLKDTHPGVRRCNGVVVSAATSADALAAAKARYSGDSPQAWADATVVTLADVAANAPGLAGWRFRVAILDASPVIDVEVTATGGDDTIDEIGALMEAALDAAGLTATYTAATQTLEIAAIADNIGDKTVLAEWYPPAAVAEERVAIPGLIVSVQHQGIAGAALNCVFPADTYVIPTIYRVLYGRSE